MIDVDSRREVFIVDAVRTVIGRHGGALAHVRPDDLAASVVRSLVERSPSLDPEAIDECSFGNANGAGEENRNVARMAVLLGGLPTSISGSTVNRLCGSGMSAVHDSSRAIACGDAEVIIAGGVESLTRAPWVVMKPATGHGVGSETMHSTTLGWRLVNPVMPGEWTIALGEGAEVLADRYAIGRDQQDAFAVASHAKATSAWATGAFNDEVVPVPNVTLVIDESVRPATSTEGLAELRPSFRPTGTVTAGNASPLNDGASALLLASRPAVERFGFAPLARVLSRATCGVDPHLFGIGPVEAVRTALRRAGLSFCDLAAVELNEAFAAQSLACLAEWPDLDPSIVNPLGGAIALGHPLGCSGARIITTLAHHLERTGGRYGLAAMCIGVGQGIATVIENVASIEEAHNGRHS
jgi:acetyl-CoA acetyltransferase family protein